jgi:hypothetical protein
MVRVVETLKYKQKEKYTRRIKTKKKRKKTLLNNAYAVFQECTFRG